MYLKKVVLVWVCFFESLVMADVAKLGVLVLDDKTGEPLRNVEVHGSFEIKNGWAAWKESPPPNKDIAITDANGRCHLRGKTNCGDVGCWVQNAPAGYYAPREGWGHWFQKRNLFGVWQPDNLVATIRLQRVEHPIPLLMKRVVLNVGKEIASVNEGWFSYDLMVGDWLPPFGHGKTADIDFHRQPHEELGEDANSGGYKGQMFRDSITVRFTGKDNGLVELRPQPKDKLRIRTAPGDGYRPDYLCYRGLGKKLKYETNYNEDRCFCFRIRTCRDDNGEIVEAYYGKIYGDIEIFSGHNYVVKGIQFRYYLNPTSLDRNLEWDCKTNLFNPKKKIYGNNGEMP